MFDFWRHRAELLASSLLSDVIVLSYWRHVCFVTSPCEITRIISVVSRVIVLNYSRHCAMSRHPYLVTSYC